MEDLIVKNKKPVKDKIVATVEFINGDSQIKIDDIVCFQFQTIFDDFCCGQAIIGNVSYVYSHITDKKYKNLVVKILTDSLMCKCDDNQNLFKDMLNDGYRTSILITLIDNLLINLFIDAGFTKLSEFVNCKTGNTVTILQGILEHDEVYADDRCNGCDEYIDNCCCDDD